MWDSFTAFGNLSLPLTGARALELLPLVVPAARPGFETWYRANWQELAGPGLAALPNATQAAVASSAARGIYGKVTNASTGATVSVRADPLPQPDPNACCSNYSFWVPVAQVSPLLGNTAAILYDVHNETLRRLAADTAISTGRAACTDLIQLVQDANQTASSLMMAPMVWAPTGQTTGIALVVFSWKQILLAQAPPSFAEVVVVVSGPFKQATLLISGGAVSDVGFADNSAAYGALPQYRFSFSAQGDDSGELFFQARAHAQHARLRTSRHAKRPARGCCGRWTCTRRAAS